MLFPAKIDRNLGWIVLNLSFLFINSIWPAATFYTWAATFDIEYLLIYSSFVLWVVITILIHLIDAFPSHSNWRLNIFRYFLDYLYWNTWASSFHCIFEHILLEKYLFVYWIFQQLFDFVTLFIISPPCTKNISRHRQLREKNRME